MKELPELAHFGFIGKSGCGEEKDDREFDADKIEKIKKFIVENIRRTKGINRSACSYTIKHIIEDLIDGYDYISNGECIKAFMELGYTVQPVQGGLNAYFGISNKDLNVLRDKRRGWKFY